MRARPGEPPGTGVPPGHGPAEAAAPAPRRRGWRARLRGLLAGGPEPAAPGAQSVQHAQAVQHARAVQHAQAVQGDGAAWSGVAAAQAMRLLALTEQIRGPLDELEHDEEDPVRVERLYQVDHGMSRIRRMARELLVLAGQVEQDADGDACSLLDVVRLAVSGIEFYDRVELGAIADGAVAGYAAEDLATLLGTLIDNGTRLSRSPVLVGTHVFANGAVTFRVEDQGIGMDPAWVEYLNRVFTGPVMPVHADLARGAGLAVAHRLAARHGLGLELAPRRAAPGGYAPPGSAGTGLVAMVTIPPTMLAHRSAVPAFVPAAPPAAPLTVQPFTAPSAAPAAGAPFAAAPSGPGRAAAPWPQDVPAPDGGVRPPGDEPHGLPRREAASVRGARPGAHGPVPPDQATGAAGNAPAAPPDGPPGGPPDDAADSFADVVAAFTAWPAEAGTYPPDPGPAARAPDAGPRSGDAQAGAHRPAMGDPPVHDLPEGPKP